MLEGFEVGEYGGIIDLIGRMCEIFFIWVSLDELIELHISEFIELWSIDHFDVLKCHRDFFLLPQSLTFFFKRNILAMLIPAL